MYRISLINMPFTAIEIPSIALTQLRTVVEERLGDQVRVRILYLVHDFVHYLGQEAYADLSNTTSTTGLGEWFFRQVAFPQEEDNAHEYFQRYAISSQSSGIRKGKILAKRMGLRRFMLHLLKKFQLDQEDLVGFTSMFSQNLPSFAMARLLKESNEQVVTVIGGANCESPMGPVLATRIEQLDYVFSGPALITFPQFLQHRIDGEEEKCQRIPGVFSRLNADCEHLKGRGQVGQELPIEVPVALDYDSYLDDLERNFGASVHPALPFETSRGCWWGERAHCTFCGLNGQSMAYRAMPPPKAVEYIGGLLQRYSDRCTHYEAVDNIMPKEYIEQVFPRLQVPQGVSFFYEVKADLSLSDMEVLGAAGVTQIQPGIEALSTSTLKLMKKGTTAIRNLVFLKNSIHCGVWPNWNLLIGFPGEEEDTYSRYVADFPLMHHLPPPSGAFFVRFDRFSPYHVKAQEFGLELVPYDFYRFLYPFEEDALRQIAYYFRDRNYDAPYMVGRAAWLDRISRQVERWKAHWSADGGGLKAQLCLKRRDGLSVVLDTRSGERKEIELTEAGAQLLRLLSQRGHRMADIARQAHIDPVQAEDEITRLQSQGLLFEEGGRFLSLVLEEEEAAAILARRPAAADIGLHRLT